MRVTLSLNLDYKGENFMKKFLKGAILWKSMSCYIFTATIIVLTIIGMFFDVSTIEVSKILSILLVSAILPLIQLIAFSECVFKKLKYSIRSIIFIIPCGALLTGSALIFDWFPIKYASSWIIFSLIFILVFIGITIAFEIYFRVTGQKYEGALIKYKKSNDND